MTGAAYPEPLGRARSSQGPNAPQSPAEETAARPAGPRTDDRDDPARRGATLLVRPTGELVAQQQCYGLFQFAAIHDSVHHTMVQQKLRTLEALGQLLFDGLFDHAWTGKPDQRLWLRKVHIAEH